MSLDRKILDRIENENLKIRPKWFFTMKNLIFGVGTFLASILGSLSLALLFEIMKQQGKNLTWLSVPYLYIILLGIFMFGGYWLVTKVDSLYKMRLVPVIALLFFISLSFGYLTFASGEAGRIERELEEVPIYTKIVSVNREIPLENYGKHQYHHQKEHGEEIRDDRDSDRHKDKNSCLDNNKNSEIDNEESSRGFEFENKDEENEVLEKTHSTDVDEEYSVKSEVKGVSNEAVENETEDEDKEEDEKEEEIEEEKEDLDSDSVSQSKDISEDDEPEDITEED